MRCLSRFGNRKAFTLAEVLITLGIIGVVAAMTIPTLIANTRAQQYRARLKKTISTISQSAKMSQAQYGFDFAGLEGACTSNGALDNPESIQTICALLNGTLTGATYVNRLSDLKINNSKNYSFTSSYLRSLGSPNSSSYRGYILSDGTIFAFYTGLGRTNACAMPLGETLKSVYLSGLDFNLSDCYGFIDVNGVQLPNTEVSCSSGTNSLDSSSCVVKNDIKHLTDIFPVRLHDGIVEPATAAGRFVLRIAN